MNYFLLKDNISCVAHNMINQIYVDMKRFNKKEYDYYFSLVIEVFKGIEVCSNAIDITAYSQAGTLLRQLIEQVATARIISASKKNLKVYASFVDEKSVVVQTKDESALKEKFEKSNYALNGGNYLTYCSIGWLESLGEEVSFDSFLRLADMVDLKQWRNFCNNFVHTNFFCTQFSQENIQYTVNEFIYLIAVLFDEICCSYHNLTNFNFVFDGVNMFEIFRKNYAQINQQRNGKK